MRASLALVLVALACVLLIDNVDSLKAVRLSSSRNGQEDERPIALRAVLDDETRIPNVRRRKALAAPRRRALGWSDSDNVNDDDDDEDGVDLEADAGTGDLRDQNTVLEDYSQQQAVTQPVQTTQTVLPSMDSLGLGAVAKTDDDAEESTGGGIDNSNPIGGVEVTNDSTATVEDTEETVGLKTDEQGAGGAGAATGGSSLFNIAEEGEETSAGAETGAVDGAVRPQQPQQQFGGGMTQQGQEQPSQAQAGVAWGLNDGPGAGAGGGVQNQGTGAVAQGGFVRQQQQPAGDFVQQQQQQQQPAGGFAQQQPAGGFVQQQPAGGFAQQQPAGGSTQQQQQQQPAGGSVQQLPAGGFVGQQGQQQQATGGFVGQQGQVQRPQVQPNGAGGLINGGAGGQVQGDDNGPVGLGSFAQQGAQQGAQQATQTGFGGQQQPQQTLADPTQQGQADGLGFGDQQAVGLTEPQAGGQGAGQQQEGQEGGAGLGDEQLGPNLRVSQDSEAQTQPWADAASSEASLVDSTGAADTTYNTSGDTASLVDNSNAGEEAAGGQLWNRQENDGGAEQTVQLEDEAGATGTGGTAVSDSDPVGFQGAAAAHNENQTQQQQQQQWGQGLGDGQTSQGRVQGQGQPDDSMLGLGGLGTQPGSVAGGDGAASQQPQQQAEPQPRVQVGGPDDSVIGIGGGGAIDATADPGTVATLNGDTGGAATSWGGEGSDPAFPSGTGQIGSATDVTGPAGSAVHLTDDVGLGSGTAAGVDGLTQPGSLTGINAEDVETKPVEEDTVDLSSTGGAILSSTDYPADTGAGNGQGVGGGVGGGDGGGIGGGVRPHGAGQGVGGGWGHGAGHGGHGQGGGAGGVGPRAGGGAGHPRGAGAGAGAGIGFGGGAGAGSNLGHTDPIGSDPSVVGHAAGGGAGVADVALEDVRQEQDAWTRGAGSQSQQTGALATEPQKVNNVVIDSGYITSGASGPLEVGSTRLFDSAQAIETIQAMKMPSGSLELSFNILTIMTIATLGGGGVLCCCRKRSGAGSKGWHNASPRDATRGFTPRNNILPVTKGDFPKEAPHSGRRQVKDWGDAPHSSKRGIKDSWGGTDWTASETTWDATKAVGQRSGSKTPGRDQMMIRDLEGAWDGGWDDATPSPVGSARTPGGVGRAQMQVSAAAMVQRSGHSGTMEAMSPRHKKAVMAMAQQAVAASAAAAAAAGLPAGEREPSKKQIKLAKD